MKHKRAYAIVVIFSLLLSIVNINDIYASETSEEAFSCSFEDGVLTIIGSGEIKNPDIYSDPPWEQYREQTKKLVLDDRITDLGEYTFIHFRALEEIVWPQNLESLGIGAFTGCTSLKKVSIPDELNDWGCIPFWYCTGLEEVEIGSCNASTFAMSGYDNPFWGDTSIKKITVSDENKYFLNP